MILYVPPLLAVFDEVLCHNVMQMSIMLIVHMSKTSSGTVEDLQRR